MTSYAQKADVCNSHSLGHMSIVPAALLSNSSAPCTVHGLHGHRLLGNMCIKFHAAGSVSILTLPVSLSLWSGKDMLGLGSCMVPQRDASDNAAVSSMWRGAPTQLMVAGGAAALLAQLGAPSWLE